MQFLYCFITQCDFLSIESVEVFRRRQCFSLRCYFCRQPRHVSFMLTCSSCPPFLSPFSSWFSLSKRRSRCSWISSCPLLRGVYWRVYGRKQSMQSRDRISIHFLLLLFYLLFPREEVLQQPLWFISPLIDSLAQILQSCLTRPSLMHVSYLREQGVKIDCFRCMMEKRYAWGDT